MSCVKQNTPVKTFSDLVGERVSSSIINFEQVIEPFLVLNIYFTFFLSLVDRIFTRVLLRVTAYYYYVTYASEAVVRSCSVKKAFLEISQNSQENACARASFLKKRLWHRCFPVNLAKFLRSHPVATSSVSE